MGKPRAISSKIQPTKSVELTALSETKTLAAFGGIL
jgi:hypothetical protein